MAKSKPLVVSLKGSLDMSRQDDVRQALMPTYDVAHVVIDLSGVDYLDSSALSALLVKRRIRKEHGFPPARLAGLSPKVRRVFSQAALDRVWPIFPTVTDAIRSFPATDNGT